MKEHCLSASRSQESSRRVCLLLSATDKEDWRLTLSPKGSSCWVGGEHGERAVAQPHRSLVTFSSTSDKHRGGRAGVPQPVESGQARPLLLTSPHSPQCITFFHPILSSCHLEISLQMGGLAIGPPPLWNQISHPEDMLSLPGLRSGLPVYGQPPDQRPLASHENKTFPAHRTSWRRSSSCP